MPCLAPPGRRLTPRQVVDDARDPAAVLHACFEWDDVRAAELHREQQARHVIASLRVITPTTATTPAVQRVYVSVVETHGDEKERAYRPLSVVREDPVQRDAVLDEARRGCVARAVRELGGRDGDPKPAARGGGGGVTSRRSTANRAARARGPVTPRR